MTMSLLMIRRLATLGLYTLFINISYLIRHLLVVRMKLSQSDSDTIFNKY